MARDSHSGDFFVDECAHLSEIRWSTPAREIRTKRWASLHRDTRTGFRREMRFRCIARRLLDQARKNREIITNSVMTSTIDEPITTTASRRFLRRSCRITPCIRAIARLRPIAGGIEPIVAMCAAPGCDRSGYLSFGPTGIGSPQRAVLAPRNRQGYLSAMMMMGEIQVQ